MNIKVCVSYHLSIEAKCQASLEALRKSKRHNYDIATCKSPELTQSRNRLVWDFKKYDYILTVDSDIEFTEDDVDHLLSLNKEFCALPYIIKLMPEYYEAGLFHKGEPGFIKERINVDTKGRFEVDYVGAGLNLYPTTLLQKLEYPFYREEIIKADNPFGKDTSGEDVGFCMNCRRINVKPFVDFGRPVHHITRSDESPGGEKILKLSMLEVGYVLGGLDLLPRKVSNPIYEKISLQVGKK